jgi:hypothetical protein
MQAGRVQATARVPPSVMRASLRCGWGLFPSLPGPFSRCLARAAPASGCVLGSGGGGGSSSSAVGRQTVIRAPSCGLGRGDEARLERVADVVAAQPRAVAAAARGGGLYAARDAAAGEKTECCRPGKDRLGGLGSASMYASGTCERSTTQCQSNKYSKETKNAYLACNIAVNDLVCGNKSGWVRTLALLQNPEPPVVKRDVATFVFQLDDCDLGQVGSFDFTCLDFIQGRFNDSGYD